MTQNILIDRTQQSKPSLKIIQNKSYSDSEQATIEKLRAAFRSMRFLTKEEQKARKKEIAEIERKYGLMGVQEHIMKELGLN